MKSFIPGLLVTVTLLFGFGSAHAGLLKDGNGFEDTLSSVETFYQAARSKDATSDRSLSGRRDPRTLSRQVPGRVPTGDLLVAHVPYPREDRSPQEQKEDSPRGLGVHPHHEALRENPELPQGIRRRRGAFQPFHQ